MRKIVLMSVVVLLAAAAVAWAATTPAVVTGAATAVSTSAAVLHGTVNPGGSATSYNFIYGPTTSYGATSKTKRTGRGTEPLSVLAGLSGLTPGTLYHYRIEATNALGGGVGLDRTFTTTGHPPPEVVTDLATSVGRTTATLQGTVVSQNQATSWFFQWGGAPTYGEQTFGGLVSPAPGPTYVSYTLTGLSPGTTFHYRVVGEHTGFGPEYGLDQAFTTLPLNRWRARVIAHTTPARARHKPYLFTTTGVVVPSVALPPAVGCTGVVNVRFFLGTRRVGSHKAVVQANCAYATAVGFRHLIDHTATRLRVLVHFRGNPYLRPASARTRQVRLG
ncbi:MAG TPA: hypothetical protein VG275_08050 [Solirubrobacteraceae bacterium]|jgi:hypothetical protein|nr:hypothetical protein [Solirubrobacteraceae bacterium]